MHMRIDRSKLKALASELVQGVKTEADLNAELTEHLAMKNMATASQNAEMPAMTELPNGSKVSTVSSKFLRRVAVMAALNRNCCVKTRPA